MIGPKVAAPSKAEENDALEFVKLRDFDACVICHKTDTAFGMSTDHRKDRSVGGKTVATNLQKLCGSGTTLHHGWKGDHVDEAIARGLAVPGWGDPAEWPARRLVRTDNGSWVLWWVIYDDSPAGFYEISLRDVMDFYTRKGAPLLLDAFPTIGGEY